MKLNPSQIRALLEDLPNEAASRIGKAVSSRARNLARFVAPYASQLAQPVLPGEVNRGIIENSVEKLLATAGKELMSTPVRDLSPQRVKYLKHVALHEKTAKDQGQPYGSNAEAAIGSKLYDAAGRVLDNIGNNSLANSEGMQGLTKVASVCRDLSKADMTSILLEVPKYLMDTKFGRRVASWLQRNRL